MKIKLICIGKLKESYWTNAVSEYAKRMTSYAKLEIIELPDEKIPDKPYELLSNITEKEGLRVLQKIDDKDFCITLEIEGVQLTSIDFSKLLQDKMTGGVSSISFVIGGSLGLHESVTKRANYRLSFSKMTFPHQLMRVVLMEQIYRAFKIMKAEPYHK